MRWYLSNGQPIRQVQPQVIEQLISSLIKSMVMNYDIMEKLLNILPIIIMLESFAAAVPLLICRRWGSGLYWLSAGLLNLAVIFLIKKWG